MTGELYQRFNRSDKNIGPSAADRQAQLDRDKAAFFASGGKARQIPSGVMKGDSEHIVHGNCTRERVPDREVIDGEVMLTAHAVAPMLNVQTPRVYQLSTEGKLPKPVIVRRVSRWRLSDIERYSNGH